MACVYLAGRHSRREELVGYAAELEAMGHRVSSRWLAGRQEIDERGLSVEAGWAERERFALEDVEDVFASTVVICFTEAARTTSSRGGRHVEMGLALGFGRQVWVVGPAENVFCCLPWVGRFATWAQAAAAAEDLAYRGDDLGGPE